MIRTPDHDALFPAIGLYLHFPFCARKCSYCDFPSYAGQDDQMAAYVAALRKEIAAAPRRQVRTIFLGGGTPSYLPGPWMADVLADVFAHFDVLPGAEVTMEANPGNERLRDVDAVAEWAAYRAMGVNRVSLGVQSFDAGLLKALGRIHQPEDAEEAVRAIKAAGFERISIDLMFGLPGQDLATWEASLRRAIALELPHLSAYSLIVEPHTPFETMARQGKLKLPDEAVERDMAEATARLLEPAGYRQYEISNWARPREESRHNQVYWRNEPWLGLGSGAHSYFRRRRFANPTTIPAYLSQGPTPLPEQPAPLAEELEETMFMGLRLTREGVEHARFRARFGVDVHEVYGPAIARLVSDGLLLDTPERLVLSERGLSLANEVFEAFLLDEPLAVVG